MKNGKLSQEIMNMFDKCICEYNRVNKKSDSSYSAKEVRTYYGFGKCHW